MDEREWIDRLNTGERMALADIEQATANPGEGRTVNIPHMFVRPLDPEAEQVVCQSCGAVVVDHVKHVKWHADA